VARHRNRVGRVAVRSTRMSAASVNLLEEASCAPETDTSAAPLLGGLRAIAPGGRDVVVGDSRDWNADRVCVRLIYQLSRQPSDAS
jgi:hypothetical protein